MTVPGVEVWLMAGYGLVLLAVAYLLDHLGHRSAKKSVGWRTGNFVYHQDQDAWKCHEDQWLWPTEFDPEKRVIRYAGQHAICGRCPAKTECSPTPGPREITRQVDPWPHSEAGRFHRGIAIAVVAAGLMLVVGSLLAHHEVGDVVVLGVAGTVVLAGLVHLVHGLANRPENAPEHLVHREGGVARVPGASGPGAPEPGGAVDLGLPTVRYASQRRSALGEDELDAMLSSKRRGATLVAGTRAQAQKATTSARPRR